MVEITYQMVLSTLQTIALIVGIAYYLIIMRNSQRNQQIQIETRQAQLFMQIYDHYNDREFAKMVQEPLNVWKWEDVDDGWEKYGPETNIEASSTWISVFNYFKGVGVLVKRNQMDISVVHDLLSSFLVPIWEKWEPMIMRYRELYNQPTAWEGAEYLYKELIRYIEEHPELKT